MTEGRELRDQLSKEQETNSNSYWRSQFSFLQKDYDEQAKQLDKERKMRKDLVDALDTILEEYDKDELIIRVGRFDKLKTLIAKAKATELDKNEHEKQH